MRFSLVFLILGACRAQRPGDTGKDSGDTGDSADTADSVDTSDSGSTDLGDLALRLTHTGGCADLVAYASSADLHYALYVRADGLIALTPDGTVASYSYTLPDPAAVVELDLGESVGSDPCNDTPLGEVEDTLVALTGDLTLSVDESNPDDVRADVFVSDLELYSEATDTVASVSSIAILDAHVGWLPG